MNRKQEIGYPPYLTIIMLLITCTASFAQNRHTIDSLKNIIAKTNQDTTRIQAYLNLSCEFENYNPDSALTYADMALNKSLKMNYKRGIAEAYRQKGVISIYYNNYKMADSLLNIALSVYKEINDQKGIVKCYVSFSGNAYYTGENRLMLQYCLKALQIAKESSFDEGTASILKDMGVAYKRLGEYEKAIECELNALKIFEKLGNENGIAACYNNIGCFFNKNKEYEKALEYLNRALQLYVEMKNTRRQSDCYANIGNAYSGLKKTEEALKSYNLALQLSIKNNDLRKISSDYNEIGGVYYEQAKYNKAIEYYNKSLEIKKQIKDERGIAIIYSNIAQIQIKRKKYDLAEEYCLKSLKISKQNEELDNQRMSLEQLAIIYNLTGKYEEAYNIYIKADEIKDSLFTVEKAEKIAQLEEKYLNEKFENNLKQTEISQQKKLRNLYLTGFVSAIIAILIIITQYRKKTSAYKFLVAKNLDVLSKEREPKTLKRKITISDDKKEEILEKLEQLLDNEKIYRDGDLTIDKLAKCISTNRNYLSQTIYKEFGKNYKDFINEYRIKEAMVMLSDPITYKKYSIDAIAIESGFNTKSNFNRIFKNYTGATPSVFNRENTLKFK